MIIPKYQFGEFGHLDFVLMMDGSKDDMKNVIGVFETGYASRAAMAEELNCLKQDVEELKVKLRRL